MPGMGGGGLSTGNPVILDAFHRLVFHQFLVVLALCLAGSLAWLLLSSSGGLSKALVVEPKARKILRTFFGLLWILDGVLQYQPQMPLGFADGVLYCVTGMAEAIALDPADGKVKWRVKLPAPARGAPTIAGGRLFVPTIENQVLALKIADGERLWAYRGQPVTAMALGLPAPAVQGDVVVAGLASGEVAAIRVADGRPNWTEALGAGRGNTLAEISGISGLPVVRDGRVYVTAQRGATVALDLRSGRRLWDRGVSSSETPWVAGDWMFVRTNNQELVCFSRTEGTIRWLRALPRWKNETKREEPITWGGPFVAGGRVLITGNNGELLEVSAADGEPMSRIKLPGPTLLQPMIFGKPLYLLTEEAELVAIRGA